MAALFCAAISGCAALQAPPGAPALHERAAAAYAAGDMGAAVSAYRAYLEIVPDDPHSWYRLGNSLARSGRLREAEAAYYHALALDPGQSRTRHNLGLVQMELGWRSLLEARQNLPATDDAAANTACYLGYLTRMLRGETGPPRCGGTSTQGEIDD